MNRIKTLVSIGLVAITAIGINYKEVHAATAGWRQDSVGWWYQNANGSYKKDEWYQNTDGQWYYFNSDGYMATNCWVDDAYYVGNSGTIVRQYTGTVDLIRYGWNMYANDGYGAYQPYASTETITETSYSSSNGLLLKGLVPIKNLESEKLSRVYGDYNNILTTPYYHSINNYLAYKEEDEETKQLKIDNPAKYAYLFEGENNDKVWGYIVVEYPELSEVFYDGCYWDTAPVTNENIIALVNEIRAVYGRSPVIWEQEMQDDAQLRAEETVKYQTAAHTRPSGKKISRYKYSNGKNYGENQQQGNNYDRCTNCVSMILQWILSEKHFENMLSEYYEVMAVAWYCDPSLYASGNILQWSCAIMLMA